MKCPGCRRRVWRGEVMDTSLWHRQCARTAQRYEAHGREGRVGIVPPETLHQATVDDSNRRAEVASPQGVGRRVSGGAEGSFVPNDAQPRSTLPCKLTDGQTIVDKEVP